MKYPMKVFVGVSAIAATLVCGIAIGQALANQPHMENALAALREARAQLVIATPDKGGHRVAAIGFVDKAILETRAGMAYSGD
ncbi:MAG: hypothetical protein ABSD74_20760 [Rhizomicrobium sp.]|jgi:hypothetical protein